MKIFLIKLGIFQTILYSFFFYLSFTDVFTDDGKKVMPFVSIIFYILSMYFTLKQNKKKI